jgi:CheY-like chemotaxis protein
MFAASARQKGLQLKWNAAPSVPATMHGDPDRIGQILVNLIGNAVKFTEAGGVEITVADGSGGVDFSVRDTGIGIPLDKRGLLFQPFMQVDSSLTRRHGGTGLGLAICKELAALMGGTIEVQSEHGRGSIFTFTLPLQQACGQERTPPAGNFSGELGRRIHILLVEDDPMVREIIALMLVNRGCLVETAESGRVALEKSAQGNFDFILMDLQMPEMNGLEATRKIRQRERETGKRTPIVGLTAHARRETREECLKSGMDDVLTKPVRMRDLYSALGG